jgi:hypothetical protein
MDSSSQAYAPTIVPKIKKINTAEAGFQEGKSKQKSKREDNQSIHWTDEEEKMYIQFLI